MFGVAVPYRRFRFLFTIPVLAIWRSVFGLFFVAYLVGAPVVESIFMPSALEDV